ncbi:hypothetical protein PCASD_22896 [Puccinia coronata f. sp. avenae]|uniref:Uncharacterized protein n=1 Tax=Puccinia coronata f. sp. avenae TaxID=200324 RepID=A0A2N5U347_9BASI|nr:hypothetical protein PCASD_22896 [Puccinia coronata f. sp. avenae]
MPLQPVNPISPPPPENQSLQRSLPLHVFPSLIPYHLRHLPYHLRCAPPVSPAMSYGLPNNTSITKDNPLPPGGNCFHSQPVDQIKFNIMRDCFESTSSSPATPQPSGPHQLPFIPGTQFPNPNPSLRPSFPPAPHQLQPAEPLKLKGGLIAARPKGVRTPKKVCSSCTPLWKGVQRLHAIFTPSIGVQACDPARQACRACTPVWRACKACTPFGQACRLCAPVDSRKPLDEPHDRSYVHHSSDCAAHHEWFVHGGPLKIWPESPPTQMM